MKVYAKFRGLIRDFSNPSDLLGNNCLRILINFLFIGGIRKVTGCENIKEVLRFSHFSTRSGGATYRSWRKELCSLCCGTALSMLQPIAE